MPAKKHVARAVMLFIFVLFTSSCTSISGPQPDSSCSKLIAQRLITITSLMASLPSTTIVAGFDVDDTVLFSSPGFYYGMTNTDGPKGTNKYGADVLMNGSSFWPDMNQKFDKFSIPKETGKALLTMHRERGDGIVFITARFCSPEDKTILAQTLKTDFGLNEFKLDCTDNNAKTTFIEEEKVDIYYGDADTDMEYARAAAKAKKVRPVRVQRSPLSTNKGGYKPGAFCEEILVNSEN
jgi:acid phosphatase (class B)